MGLCNLGTLCFSKVRQIWEEAHRLFSNQVRHDYQMNVNLLGTFDHVLN